MKKKLKEHHNCGTPDCCGGCLTPDKPEDKLMDIKLVYDPFPHLIIDNVYTDLELKEIWQELDFLTYPHKAKTALELGAAIDQETGESKASNTGFLLDDIYGDRNISNILRHNRKIFCEDIINSAVSLTPLYRDAASMNADTTKIRYYDDGESYAAHYDDASYTFCTYFYKDKDKIIGGQLTFPEFDYTIETINNRAIFFKGCLEHQALPSYRVGEWRPFDGYGRYCMNQFLMRSL